MGNGDFGGHWMAINCKPSLCREWNHVKPLSKMCCVLKSNMGLQLKWCFSNHSMGPFPVCLANDQTFESDYTLWFQNFEICKSTVHLIEINLKGGGLCQNCQSVYPVWRLHPHFLVRFLDFCLFKPSESSCSASPCMAEFPKSAIDLGRVLRYPISKHALGPWPIFSQRSDLADVQHGCPA